MCIVTIITTPPAEAGGGSLAGHDTAGRRQQARRGRRTGAGGWRAWLPFDLRVPGEGARRSGRAGDIIRLRLRREPPMPSGLTTAVPEAFQANAAARHSSIRVQPSRVRSAVLEGGALMSTVDDLTKWDAALAAGRVRRADSLTKSFTSYKLASGSESGYGYGWGIGRYVTPAGTRLVFTREGSRLFVQPGDGEKTEIFLAGNDVFFGTGRFHTLHVPARCRREVHTPRALRELRDAAALLARPPRRMPVRRRQAHVRGMPDPLLQTGGAGGDARGDAVCRPSDDAAAPVALHRPPLERALPQGAQGERQTVVSRLFPLASRLAPNPESRVPILETSPQPPAPV